MARRREEYKIISDLIRYGSADVSNSPKWVGYLNRYVMALEDYMACYPDDCKMAMEAAQNYREEMKNDGYNKKSYARYCLMGCLPECVSKLFSEVYPDVKDRRSALIRFFNSFPAFKVTTKKL